MYLTKPPKILTTDSFKQTNREHDMGKKWQRSWCHVICILYLSYFFHHITIHHKFSLTTRTSATIHPLQRLVTADLLYYKKKYKENKQSPTDFTVATRANQLLPLHKKMAHQQPHLIKGHFCRLQTISIMRSLIQCVKRAIRKGYLSKHVIKSSLLTNLSLSMSNMLNSRETCETTR